MLYDSPWREQSNVLFDVLELGLDRERLSFEGSRKINSLASVWEDAPEDFSAQALRHLRWGAVPDDGPEAAVVPARPFGEGQAVEERREHGGRG